MVTILTAVLAAAAGAAVITGLLGLFAAVITGLLGLFAGVHLERERSREWARKEAWAYKRQTYEETFNVLTENVWWLQASALAGDAILLKRTYEKQDEQSRKLSGLLCRMKVFLNEDAQKAIDD